MGVAHTRTRAHAAHAAHAAQDTTLARAAAAVNDIQFSVSVRGIHWLTANDVIAHELGEQRACKVRMHALAYTRTHAQVRSSSVSPRARAHTRVCVSHQQKKKLFQALGQEVLRGYEQHISERERVFRHRVGPQGLCWWQAGLFFFWLFFFVVCLFVLFPPSPVFAQLRNTCDQ